MNNWTWRSTAERYGPPLLWMALISAASSDAFSATNTGSYLLPVLRWLFPGATPAGLEMVHAGIRKAMHLLEYAVLALLWYRALRPPATPWRTRVAVIAWGLSAAFAGVDEFRQTFVPSRTGSLVDVGWDSLGAALALLAFPLFQPAKLQASREALRPDAPGGTPPS